MGKQQTERMAVQTALIDCPGKFVSLVEWLGRVRGEEVTNGGFDCALFVRLAIEPAKNILVGVAVELQPEKLCILRSVSGIRVLVTIINLLSTR
ncbi:MAG: hypothetical protein PUJ39_12270 [Eubacteriales bacterium]|nr:hypothetical protein [Eubacteriales bacterium]